MLATEAKAEPSRRVRMFVWIMSLWKAEIVVVSAVMGLPEMLDIVALGMYVCLLNEM